MSAPTTRTYLSQKPTTGIDVLRFALGALAEIQTFFALNGVDLPERQAIAAGEPTVIAWDCAQLVVTMASIGWGRSVDATQLSPTFGKAASVDAMRHAEINIQLVRKTPTITDGGRAPNVAQIEAAGEQYFTDAGLLSQALVNFVSFPNDSVPIGCNVQAGAVQPIGPEGDLVGLSVGLVITAGVLAEPPIPTIPSGHP